MSRTQWVVSHVVPPGTQTPLRIYRGVIRNHVYSIVGGLNGPRNLAYGVCLGEPDISPIESGLAAITGFHLHNAINVLFTLNRAKEYCHEHAQSED